MGIEFILQKIQDTYDSFNSMTNEAISMLQQSPETTTYWDTIQSVHSVIVAFAMTLAVMYFLCELMNKSIDIERASYIKVFSIAIRLVFCKVILEHSLDLMLGIFKIGASLLEDLQLVGALQIPMNTDSLRNQLEDMSFIDRVGEFVSLQPNIVVISFIGVIIYLIVYGRLIQLSVYTALSPIPLANLAAESQQRNAVHFLKKYASVCFQSIVMVLAVAIYGKVVSDLSDGSIFKTLLTTSILLLLIVKSGEWSKEILGLS